MSIRDCVNSNALTWVLDWCRLCASSSFRRHMLPSTCKKTHDIGSFSVPYFSKIRFKTTLIITFRVEEGKNRAITSTSQSCVEAKQKSSSALTCIIYDLASGFSHQHTKKQSVHVYIVVVMDLVLAESIRFDAFLKLFSPLSGKRHVLEIGIIKFWTLSKLFVVFVAEDQADLIVGLEEATFHS